MRRLGADVLHGARVSRVSTDSLSRIDDLLDAARSGDRDALGKLFEIYRNYIGLLASSQLRSRLRVRASASDIVQDTFMNAHKGFDDFRGTTGNEFVVWLRAILTRRIQYLVHHHVDTKARDVRKELSLDTIQQWVDDSCIRIETVFHDKDLTPASHLQNHQRSLQVANALAGLAEDYRDVLTMRSIDGLGFQEIADRMGRNHGAVRMLWLRAIQALRDQLKERDAR